MNCDLPFKIVELVVCLSLQRLAPLAPLRETAFPENA